MMPRVAPKSNDPYLGRELDEKFLIKELLGLGGMGRVYKAVQLSLDKIVCVKVLRLGMMQDDTLVRRFHREARASSRLNHPNSITIIDFGQAKEDGALYLVMEYVPGKDLGKVILKEHPLTEKRIVLIMDQVLSALADAHAANIVHRDLKPENIMVTDLRGTKDFVKVLDFGIAKLNEKEENAAEANLTQVGMVCGTPEYMSPEQARGEKLDARSDLYSVGVILYHMVTKRLPFTAPTAMGIVTKHLVEPPVPPSQLEGVKVSAALENVILKAMSKDRNGRQATALALQQELNAALSPKVAPAQEVPAGQDLFDTSSAKLVKPTAEPKVEPAPLPAATVMRPAESEAAQPQAQPAPQAGAEKPAKSSTGLIIGVLVALLLAGGGVGGYFIWQKMQADAGGDHPVVDDVLDAAVDDGSVQADAGAAVAVPSSPDASSGPADAGKSAAADAAVALPAPADAGKVEVDAGQSLAVADASAHREAVISDIARMNYQAGKEMMAQRKLSKAVAAFQRAIAKSPDYADAYKALATCFMGKGEVTKAKKYYRLYILKRTLTQKTNKTSKT